jgi:hypothetical protein
MDIYLDHDPFDTEAATLGDILQAAGERLQPTGRIVVEIRLDGEAIPEDQLDDLAARPPQGQELQLITADPIELCTMTLTQVKSALEHNRSIARHAAELLSADEPGQAMDLIRQCLTVWQQAEQAVRTSAQVAGVSLDEITIDGAEPIPDLARKLQQVREQLQSSDWVGLSDTLAFELDDSVNQWTQLIDALLDKITKA